MVIAPTHTISVLNDEKILSQAVLLDHSRLSVRVCEVVSETEIS